MSNSNTEQQKTLTEINRLIGYLQDYKTRIDSDIGGIINTGKNNISNEIGRYLNHVKQIADESEDALDKTLFAFDLIDNAINEAYEQADRAKNNSDFLSAALREVKDISKTDKLFYRIPVQTKDDLTTSFPTPQDGWRSLVLSENTSYRYSKELNQWIAIDRTPEADFIVGNISPTNKSAIWFKQV